MHIRFGGHARTRAASKFSGLKPRYRCRRAHTRIGAGRKRAGQADNCCRFVTSFSFTGRAPFGILFIANSSRFDGTSVSGGITDERSQTTRERRTEKRFSGCGHWFWRDVRHLLLDRDRGYHHPDGLTNRFAFAQPPFGRKRKKKPGFRADERGNRAFLARDGFTAR